MRKLLFLIGRVLAILFPYHVYEKGQFENEWRDTHLFKLNRRNVIDPLKTDSIFNRVIKNETS